MELDAKVRDRGSNPPVRILAYVAMSGVLPRTVLAVRYDSRWIPEKTRLNDQPLS